MWFCLLFLNWFRECKHCRVFYISSLFFWLSFRIVYPTTCPGKWYRIQNTQSVYASSLSFLFSWLSFRIVYPTICPGKWYRIHNQCIQVAYHQIVQLSNFLLRTLKCKICLMNPLFLSCLPGKHCIQIIHRQPPISHNCSPKQHAYQHPTLQGNQYLGGTSCIWDHSISKCYDWLGNEAQSYVPHYYGVR